MISFAESNSISKNDFLVQRILGWMELFSVLGPNGHQRREIRLLNWSGARPRWTRQEFFSRIYSDSTTVTIWGTMSGRRCGKAEARLGNVRKAREGQAG